MDSIYLLNNLSGDEKFNAFYLILLLALIGSSFFARSYFSTSESIKNAALWVGIILLLVLAYSYRYEFSSVKNRLVGELLPSRAISNEDGSISIKVSRDGHYHINAKVENTSVEFLVDTGASDVTLTTDTARQLGINIKDLEFNKIYNTANGQVRGAPITINAIRIGDIVVYNVKASVNEAQMDKPLLGMSFLEKLGGYEVRNGTLTMWK